MTIRWLALLMIVGAADQARAQYSLQVSHWAAPVIANVSIPKPIPAAKVHQALVDQRHRMDRQRSLESSDRQAARRQLGSRESVVGQWDVLSREGHSRVQLSHAGYTISDATRRVRGVWQQEQRDNGFLLTLHSSGHSPASFAATWTVPGQQFKMVHQGTGAVYTVTRMWQ